MPRYGSPSKDQVVVLKSEDGVHHELMDGDGKRIQGVRKAVITATAGELSTMDLQIDKVRLNVVAHYPRYFMLHPHTGQIVYVKRIEFEDGTFFPSEPKRATRLIKIKASTTR